ncbi:hypothetical protein [Actinacidiphila paucisporea]|uniref:hypothetical protein n=1 Tax=Actinacidiphila paucisporea TaxID=310782 RepID=UPI0011614381|nr:hypothetical protein [Actinacidiphila paucisporea]
MFVGHCRPEGIDHSAAVAEAVVGDLQCRRLGAVADAAEDVELACFEDVFIDLSGGVDETDGVDPDPRAIAKSDDLGLVLVS